MDEVIKKNKEVGQFFFSEDTMRFFSSIVETKGELIGDKYFVTSEQREEDLPRLYSVRDFNKDNGHIRTVGNFQEFQNKIEAEEFAYCMTETNNIEECRKEVKRLFRFHIPPPARDK